MISLRVRSLRFCALFAVIGTVIPLPVRVARAAEPPPPQGLTIKFATEDIEEWRLSPDGKILACVTQKGEKPNSPSGVYSVWRQVISVWDAKTGGRLWRQEEREGKEYAKIRFSPDGKTLAASSYRAGAGDAGDVRLWDAKTGVLKRVIHRCGMQGTEFSSDGKTLAISGYGERPYAALYDAATGKRLRRLAYAGENFLWHFAFSPDSRRVAALAVLGGEAGDVPAEAILWDAQTGKQVWRTDDPMLQRSGDYLAFADSGRRLVCSERFIDLTRRPYRFQLLLPLDKLGQFDKSDDENSGTSRHLMGFVGDGAQRMPRQAWFRHSYFTSSPTWNNLIAASSWVKPSEKEAVQGMRLELWDITTKRLLRRGPDGPDENVTRQYCPSVRLLATQTGDTILLQRWQ